MTAPMQVLWLFGAVIAFTIASIAFVTLTGRRRSRQLSKTASSLGLDYQADGAALLTEGLLDLPLFAVGALSRNGTVSNVMTGAIAGVPVTACDYAYWTGSVRTNRFDYAQTLACFRLTPHRYPAFTVSPIEGGLRHATLSAARGSAEALAALAQPLDRDGRFAALGAVLERAQEPGIDVDTSSEFSSRYRVLGHDRDRIAKVLSGPALDSLVRDDFQLSVECSGPWLAIYRKNHRVAPKDMPRFLQRCVELKTSLLPG